MNSYVYTFYSTYFALKAEKYLSSAGIHFDTIPTPRQFSSDCGVAVCINSNDKQVVQAVFEKEKIEIEGCHKWNRS